jgi:hypothetical protein
VSPAGGALNPFGEKFKANGNKLPDKSAAIRHCFTVNESLRAAVRWCADATT